MLSNGVPIETLSKTIGTYQTFNNPNLLKGSGDQKQAKMYKTY